MSHPLQNTVAERPEDSDYDRASIMMAQDDYWARYEANRLGKDYSLSDDEVFENRGMW